MSHATFDSFPDACGAILGRLVRDMLLHTRPRRIDGALLNVDATLVNIECTTQCPSRLETLWRWGEYGVCVKWMLLAGFKSVESDEDML